MGGFSMVHWRIFGVVAALLFGNRLLSVGRSLQQSFGEFKRDIDLQLHKFRNGIYDLHLRYQDRGPDMRKHWNKFLWSSKFWALLGVLGCVSGLYFQHVAENGSGLWCLGLIFFGAAYLEQKM